MHSGFVRTGLVKHHDSLDSENVAIVLSFEGVLDVAPVLSRVYFHANSVFVNIV